MRIMVDTNILFSALLFPNSVPAKALLHAAHWHSIILCDHIIREFRDTTIKKRPDLLGDADAFIAGLSHETVIAPQEPSKLINDPKDAPILNAAILYEVDMIISGDMHFTQLELERPKIMKAADYLRDMETEA